MLPRILILGKAGPPGTAKTRLIPALGPEGADFVHQTIARATVTRAARWAPDHTQIAIDPFQQPPPEWTSGLPLSPQPRGDLGVRLRVLTARAFEQDPTPLIVLGTDAPDLPEDRLVEAAAACRDGHAAICPSRDGGYNLIALPHNCPELLTDIPWGTNQVTEATRFAAAAYGISLRETQGWDDVDDLAGLARLLARLSDCSDKALLQLRTDLNRVKLP